MIGNIKTERRTRRHARIRAKISGTPERPRLAVYKSNMRIAAQVIDDVAGKTLLSVSSSDFKKGTLQERTIEAGKKLAEDAKKQNIAAVVFDRGGFLYAGNIKVFADSVRSGGINF